MHDNMTSGDAVWCGLNWFRGRFCVCYIVGLAVGRFVGINVGKEVGVRVGLNVGAEVGLEVGSEIVEVTRNWK